MRRIAYRPKEVAELLGVRESTVRDWIRKNKIASVRIAKSVFVPAQVLTDLIAAASGKAA